MVVESYNCRQGLGRLETILADNERLGGTPEAGAILPMRDASRS
jgi:hypothetical protein